MFKDCINVSYSPQNKLKFYSCGAPIAAASLVCVYPGAERPGPEAQCTLPNSAEAKNGRVIPRPT